MYIENERRQLAVIDCGSMSGVRVTVSPVAAYSPAQPPLPTPSPFSFSVASTGWSSRPRIQTVGLFLRGLCLVLSFGSALSLVACAQVLLRCKHFHSVVCRVSDLQEYL